VGFSPIFVLLAVGPFREAYLEALAAFSGARGTNLPLPYPWPWRLGHGGLAWFERWPLALAFLLPPCVYAGGLLASWRLRPDAPAPRIVLAAASVVGLFWFHHASVRSDAAHLAQSIHPALLAALAAAACAGGRRLLVGSALGLLALSALAVPAVNPALVALRAGEHGETASYDADGDELRLPEATAAYLSTLEATLGRHVGAQDELLVVPSLTTLYPLTGRISPVRDSYFLWPASEERQRAIVDALEGSPIRWVLVVDSAPDGRTDLLFRNTHPLVWAELGRSYARVPTAGLPPNHLLLARR